MEEINFKKSKSVSLEVEPSFFQKIKEFNNNKKILNNKVLLEKQIKKNI